MPPHGAKLQDEPIAGKRRLTGPSSKSEEVRRSRLNRKQDNAAGKVRDAAAASITRENEHDEDRHDCEF